MKKGVVLESSGPSLAALRRWSGLALVAGGLLLAVATALHPSQETPATILGAEGRLVAAHALFTLSSLLVLLGSQDSMGPSRSGWGGLDWLGSCSRSRARPWSRSRGTSGSWPRCWPPSRRQRSTPSTPTCPLWPSTGWPSAGSWSASSCSAWPWPRPRPSLAPRVFWSPWAPRPRCSASRWPRPSHRRGGPLPSLAAWSWVPALAGLGINCGRTRRPDPLSPAPADADRHHPARSPGRAVSP